MATLLLVAALTDAAAIYNERVAIVLGFLTLLALLAVFFSCRSFLSALSYVRLGNPMNGKAYRKFYQYHAYYWWAFGVLLLAHFTMALLHTGLPKAGDRDAALHWAILALGLGAALAAGLLLVSCRIMPRLITAATSQKPMISAVFRGFFKLHNYYWWLILLLVGAHFTLSYLHAGIWPR